MDVEICAEYADRMRHGILFAATRKRMGLTKGGEVYAWLAIPLELAKQHGPELVPCLLYFVEASGFFAKSNTLESIASVLKGIESFEESSLRAFLVIDEIRAVTPTTLELRELGVRIARAMQTPNAELMNQARAWLDGGIN